MQCILISETYLNFGKSGHIEIAQSKTRTKTSVACLDDRVKLDGAIKLNESPESSEESVDLFDSNPIGQLQIFEDIIDKRERLTVGCEEFFPYEDIAFNIVDDVLNRAVEQINLR